MNTATLITISLALVFVWFSLILLKCVRVLGRTLSQLRKDHIQLQMRVLEISTKLNKQ